MPAGATRSKSDAVDAARAWFQSRGWAPFAYQEQAWDAYLRGESGLVHAPTGTGKTLSVWLGPVLEWLDEYGHEPAGVSAAARPSAPARRGNGRAPRDAAEPLRIVWITPMRALATDTAGSLREALAGMGLDAGERRWSVEVRTGDTPQSEKRSQRERLPTCLVTTPESLSLLLSYPESRERFATVRCAVVDEWHELLGTKRGVQTELGLARLRRWSPRLRTWGLSATLGNLEQARDVLLGPAAPDGRLIRGVLPKQTLIETLEPEDMERFPWAGHIGLRLLPRVLELIEGAGSTLLFTNTRAQAEIWYQAIAKARPDLLIGDADRAGVALHHGSLDRDLRARVEDMLRDGKIRCVVCTSSLDLGVDFSPVEQVIQVGSPKGIARLIQRAGRSGHRPGAPSRVVCVPTHALELIEFAAARDAAQAGRIEARPPLDRPLDLLAQHLVTIGLGGGFSEDELFEEVRATHAFRALTSEEWDWTMRFVAGGGPALASYPQFARLALRPAELGGEHEAAALTGGGAQSPRWQAASAKVAGTHRLAIGTITSDAAVSVVLHGGRSLGTIEESFIARLSPGDRFVFAGRVLELIRVRDMTAHVRKATSRSGTVPRWGGGKMPLSTQLATAVRAKLEEARLGAFTTPEMETVRPLIEVQRRWSRLPAPDELLIERIATEDGRHTFVYPFEGRLVHEGLAALVAYRLTRDRPLTLHLSATDYGFELLAPDASALDSLDGAAWARLLSTDRLLEDLLACLNATQLARRRFRDIARVAGLILPGYPGAAKRARHLQASSELFFDVFAEFDPGNLLLDQARREVLEEQLEVRRLRATLDRLGAMRPTIIEPRRLTPLAFPLWAERLRDQQVSSEKWSDMVAKMVVRLEAEATRESSGNGRR